MSALKNLIIPLFMALGVIASEFASTSIEFNNSTCIEFHKHFYANGLSTDGKSMHLISKNGKNYQVLTLPLKLDEQGERYREYNGEDEAWTRFDNGKIQSIDLIFPGIQKRIHQPSAASMFIKSETTTYIDTIDGNQIWRYDVKKKKFNAKPIKIEFSNQNETIKIQLGLFIQNGKYPEEDGINGFFRGVNDPQGYYARFQFTDDNGTSTIDGATKLTQQTALYETCMEGPILSGKKYWKLFLKLKTNQTNQCRNQIFGETINQRAFFDYSSNTQNMWGIEDGLLRFIGSTITDEDLARANRPSETVMKSVINTNAVLSCKPSEKNRRISFATTPATSVKTVALIIFLVIVAIIAAFSVIYFCNRDKQHDKAPQTSVVSPHIPKVGGY